VFCRNVLIYFDQQTKTDILRRIASQLAPDGFLVLGAAETAVGLTEAFKPLPDRRGVYVVNHGVDAKPAPRLALVAGGR
jgi:chemotaxis protein methyltransferase CheR